MGLRYVRLNYRANVIVAAPAELPSKMLCQHSKRGHALLTILIFSMASPSSFRQFEHCLRRHDVLFIRGELASVKFNSGTQKQDLPK